METPLPPYPALHLPGNLRPRCSGQGPGGTLMWSVRRLAAESWGNSLQSIDVRMGTGKVGLEAPDDPDSFLPYFAP